MLKEWSITSSDLKIKKKTHSFENIIEIHNLKLYYIFAYY